MGLWLASRIRLITHRQASSDPPVTHDQNAFASYLPPLKCIGIESN